MQRIQLLVRRGALFMACYGGLWAPHRVVSEMWALCIDCY